ncbi:hypothetical protein OQA88_3208 [Cercophora sp. LCS_1]
MDPVGPPILDADWEKHKAEIWRLYILDEVPQKNLLDEIRKLGLFATKSQLQYKLNRWGFKRNIDEPTWQKIDREIKKRKRDGKESEVIHNYKRLKPAKIAKETNRHRDWACFKGTTPGPLFSLIPNRSASHHFHPGCVFYGVHVATHPSLATVSVGVFIPHVLETQLQVAFQGVLSQPIRDAVSKAESGISKLASVIGIVMPESRPGEHLCRAGALVGLRGPDILGHYLSSIIYLSSNNFLSSYSSYEWQETAIAIRQSGLMHHRLDFASLDGATISSFAEKLFQTAVYHTVTEYQGEGWDIVEWLLSSGFDPDTPVPYLKTNVLMTALQLSALFARKDFLSSLLLHGANPNFALSGQGTPLELVLLSPLQSRPHDYGQDSCLSDRFSWEDIPDMAHLLVSRGAVANLSAGGSEDSVLFPAIRLGDLNLIGLLLNQGVDIGITAKRSQGFTCEATALSVAAGFQNEALNNATALGLVNFILGAHTLRGSPVDITALITPDVLIAAAEAGNCDVIKFLVGLSPKVGFSNSIGISALHAAAWKGCVDTCRLLLELGCPVNSPSAKSSPLHIACALDRASVAELLMLNGAAIDAAMDLDKETFQRLNLDPDENPDLEWNSPLVNELICLEPITPLRVALAFYGHRCAMALIRRNAGFVGDEVVLAAMSGISVHHDLDVLSALLDSGADADGQSLKGKSVPRILLEHHASGFLDVDLDVIKDLLMRGAELDDFDLAYAIHCTYHSFAMALFDHVYDSSDQYTSSEVVLEAACSSNLCGMLSRVLQQYQGDYSPRSLCVALDRGLDRSIIRQLLAVQRSDQRAGILDCTAISIAAMKPENMRTLEMLTASLPRYPISVVPLRLNGRIGLFELRYGDWWVNGGVNGSVLTYAAIGDTEAAFLHLLNHGYGPDWLTWLMIAKYGRYSMASTLRERGFSVPGPGRFVSSADRPLNQAISRGDTAMVRLLLEAGCPVNPSVYKVKYGRTPLQCAVENANLDMIDVLIKAGANVNARPAMDSGATALQIASIKGYVGIAEMLLGLGADVNAARSKINGRTALEGAAQNGKIEIIELLMYHGARTVGSGRRQYVRALGFAEVAGNFVAAKLLRSSRDWTAEDDEMMRRPGLLGEGNLWVDEAMDYEDEGCDEVNVRQSDGSGCREGIYECNSSAESEESDGSDGSGDLDHGAGGSGHGDDEEKEDGGEVDSEAVSPMTQLFLE